MKRDMDLFRLILLQVEEGQRPAAMSDYTTAQILDHCAQTIEAGLLEGQVVRGASGDFVGASLRRLTHEGHQFLAAARSDTVWNRVKQEMAKKSVSWTLDGLKIALFAAAAG